jgi:hypothetical protein
MSYLRGGFVQSGNSGSVSVTTLAQLTNQSVAITSIGRPINVMLSAYGPSAPALLQMNAASGVTCSLTIYLYKNGSSIAQWTYQINITGGANTNMSIPASLSYLDTAITAGISYTYAFYAAESNAVAASVSELQTTAYVI